MALAQKSPLLLAAREGDLEICRRLISASPTVLKSRTMHGMSALHFAARRGHLELCRFLLESGAQACAKDRHGMTPLDYAAVKGHAEVCRALLPDSGLGTRAILQALCYACKTGRSSACEALLEGDVKFTPRDLLRPLFFAARRGCARTCELLLSKGSEVCAEEFREEESALFVAASLNHTQVCTVLLSSTKKVDKVSFLRALVEAVKKDHTSIVKLFLRMRGSLSLEFIWKNADPLYWAIQYASLRTIGVLVDEGGIDTGLRKLLLRAADKKREDVFRFLVDKFGLPPCPEFRASLFRIVVSRDIPGLLDLEIEREEGGRLLCAASDGKAASAVRALLDRGAADPNFEDELGRTPLHLARSEQVAEILLKGGAALVRSRDRNGHTPLHAAAGRGLDRVCAVLLRHGADPNAAADLGVTPLDAALREDGNEKVCKLLLDNGARLSCVCVTHDEFWKPALLGDLRSACAWALSNQQAGRDVDLGSLLLRAADAGRAEICELLIRAGAPVQAQDRDGNSPLHLAARGGWWYPKTCSILLENGAELGALNKRGSSALAYAWNASRRVLELLLEAQQTGPDGSRPDDERWYGSATRPLAAAVVQKNPHFFCGSQPRHIWGINNLIVAVHSSSSSSSSSGSSTKKKEVLEKICREGRVRGPRVLEVVALVTSWPWTDPRDEMFRPSMKERIAINRGVLVAKIRAENRCRLPWRIWIEILNGAYGIPISWAYSEFWDGAHDSFLNFPVRVCDD